MRYCLGPPNSFGNLYAALVFMPFGLFFDFMDGKVARWRGKSSLMGQELDSLADLVCGFTISCPWNMNRTYCDLRKVSERRKCDSFLAKKNIRYRLV